MWTMENTEGFTQAEIDEINAALEHLMQRTGIDPENLNDMLNNAWFEGATAADLIAAVEANT